MEKRTAGNFCRFFAANKQLSDNEIIGKAMEKFKLTGCQATDLVHTTRKMYRKEQHDS